MDGCPIDRLMAPPLPNASLAPRGNPPHPRPEGSEKTR
ncbi:hypothetical protein SGPA1_40603 [Streptomyces misionensis JCM 4497]